MEKKKGKKKEGGKSDIKQTLIFKLMIASIILLFVLVIIWIFVYEPSKEVEEEYGLPALKWDFDLEEVVFDILDYNITSAVTNNDSVEINIKWSSGNKSINRILIDFEGVANYCNYTQINDLSFGENKTYTILSNFGNCDESNFENVSSISAYAEVHINLTQTLLISNITRYNDDSLADVVDLDDYFSSLVNISYSVVGDSEDKTGIEINNITNLVSFDPKLDRYGSYEFNLTATSDDGEILDVSTDGENMTFYVSFVNDSRPIANEAPEFNRTECDDLIWYKNANYRLNMTKCWSDEDNDTISGYRYENRTNQNINISESDDVLTLNPNSGWTGIGYFYIYATDGIEESSGRVDYIVRSLSTPPPPIVNNTDPKIKTSNPSSDSINLSNENQTFTITAENYNTIKWYLNGGVVTGGGLSRDFTNLKDGDIVKVEIINGIRVDSKTWDINISGETESPGSIDLDIGTIIFYSIIAMIIVVILLIIWMFISNKKRKDEAVGADFGVSGRIGNVRTPIGRPNIPRR